jgi:CRP-like cAMP-binding protein
MEAARARYALRHQERAGAMRRGRRVRLLSLIDVLEPLSEGDLRDLAERCPDLRLQPGQEFYRREEHDGGLFLIKEGRVRVYLITHTAKEATLDILGGGTVLWARRLQLMDAYAVHVRAVEPTVVAFMGRDDLDRFIVRNPEVA